jgi:hypothetical protein
MRATSWLADTRLDLQREVFRRGAIVRDDGWESRSRPPLHASAYRATKSIAERTPTG